MAGKGLPGIVHTIPNTGSLRRPNPNPFPPSTQAVVTPTSLQPYSCVQTMNRIGDHFLPSAGLALQHIHCPATTNEDHSFVT